MVSYSVLNLADEIFANEFDYDSGYAQFYYISGWLANNVGMLNTRLYTSFDVSGSYFTPTGSFKQEERAIYKQMYLHEFYNKKSRQVLRGVDSSVDFISLREGDSMITRTNKNKCIISNLFQANKSVAKKYLIFTGFIIIWKSIIIFNYLDI